MNDPTHIEFELVACLIEHGGKYLFVEETKPGRENKFTIPGGHVEPTETVIEAAVRETKEETGYDIELTGVIGFYQDIYTFGNFGGLVFHGNVTGGKATPSKHHPTVQWLTKEEIIILVNENRLFTKFPPFAIEDYETRGAYPLDMVCSKKHY